MKHTVYWQIRWKLAASVCGQVVALLLMNNLLRSSLLIIGMKHCEWEANLYLLTTNVELERSIKRMTDPFAVVMLNKYALNVTLNWLCNTAQMPNVHDHTVFFTLDNTAREGLLSRYPHLNVVTVRVPCLQKTFEPLDETYMSFFILRTNLIRTILKYDRSVWMLQADTFWNKNLFDAKEAITDHVSDVLLDQDGHEDIAESRKGSMNGANFFVSKSAVDLIEELYWYQSNFYVTDPDAMKIVCGDRSSYRCRFLHHSLISGWEWIYGDQSDAPYLIQLDGEGKSRKIEFLKKYKFWFLDDSLRCDRGKVAQAKQMVLQRQIPRPLSTSKMRQKILLFIGQILRNLPVFGRFYRKYGGLASLYLQIF